MWSQIVSFKPWLLNFDHKFDGQEVKNFCTYLYIEFTGKYVPPPGTNSSVGGINSGAEGVKRKFPHINHCYHPH